MDIFKVRLEYPTGQAVIYCTAESPAAAIDQAQAWVRAHHPQLAKSGAPKPIAKTADFAGENHVS